MGKFDVLSKLFYMKKPAEAIKLIGFYFIVLSVLSFFCFLLPSLVYSELFLYSKATYDFRLADTSENDILKLGSEEYIEKIFAVRSLATMARTESGSCSLDLDFIDTLENIDISPYSANFVIAGSTDDLKDTNAIAIDYFSARTLHAGIGDFVQISLGEAEDAYLDFKIVAIFQPLGKSAAQSVSLYTDEVDKKWRSIHKSGSMSVTMSWVTVSNEAKAEIALWENFHSDSYEEDNGVHTLEQINRQYNVKRQDSYAEARNAISSLPSLAFALALIGSIALLIFIFREVSKGISRSEKNLAVMKALGASTSTLSLLYLAKNIVYFFISLVLSLIFVKFFLYDMLFTDIYLAPVLVGAAALLASALYILAVSSKLGLFFHQLEKRKLLKLLNGG